MPPTVARYPCCAVLHGQGLALGPCSTPAFLRRGGAPAHPVPFPSPHLLSLRGSPSGLWPPCSLLMCPCNLVWMCTAPFPMIGCPCRPSQCEAQVCPLLPPAPISHIPVPTLTQAQMAPDSPVHSQIPLSPRAMHPTCRQHAHAHRLMHTRCSVLPSCTPTSDSEKRNRLESSRPIC